MAPGTSTRIAPMAAAIGTETPTGDGWVFEPKYDGVRLLAYATESGDVRLMTRNDRDKALQFPEIVAAARALARRRRRPYVLDGELVAWRKGEPARFQALQSRMHLTNAPAV